MGAIDLTDLQTSYDVSPDGRIIVDAALGAVKIRGNAAVASILEIESSGGVDLWLFQNTGDLLAQSGTRRILGGSAAADSLTLAANSVLTGTGRILANSPIVFGSYSATTAQYGFTYEAVESFAALFIGGGLNFSGTIGFTNGTFIYESYRGAPTINTGTNLGFAAYTVLQALPALNAGSGAGHNPLAPLVINAGPAVANGFVGARTVSTVAGMNFSPIIRTSVLGAVMNATSVTAIICAPKFSTVGGSSISFGTIRGMHVQVPAVGLFQPGNGSETMIAYYGMDVDDIGAFGGTAQVAAVRSRITSGTGQFFVLNIGGAQSAFGVGSAHWSDGAGVQLGNTFTTPDVLLNWNGSALEFDAVIGSDLRFAPNALDYWEVTGGAALNGMQFNLQHISFGTDAPNPATVNYFARFQGPALRSPNVAGSYADVLWSGSSIDIDGLAMTNVDGLRVETPALVLSGGSVDDLSNMHVDSMSSFGAARIQALRVTGRTRVDGVMCFNEATLATLTADVAALALPANNGGRYKLLQDADALGPWTIQGIVNVQVGDEVYFINNGANAFDFGHEDVAAAAADRIITPTAATWTLGPREFAVLWYDPVATRWRILDSNGA